MSKSYHFKQRVPAFIDVTELLEFDFSTVEELKNHPFIKNFLNNEPSSFLSRSDDLLMVVSDDGFYARAIGWITNMDELDIPTYEEKYIVQYYDGKNEVKTDMSENPVVSVCGNNATLKDGTKCKRIK